MVLGLVTTKVGTLESADALKRRIEAASKYAPLDQLCLSPQCGFASTEEGNNLAEDDRSAEALFAFSRLHLMSGGQCRGEPRIFPALLPPSRDQFGRYFVATPLKRSSHFLKRLT